MDQKDTNAPVRDNAGAQENKVNTAPTEKKDRKFSGGKSGAKGHRSGNWNRPDHREFNGPKSKNEKEENLPLPTGPVEIVGVNFRSAGKIYYFSPKDMKFSVGDRVIVETSRGIEMGTVKIENKIVEGSELNAPLRNVLRAATEDDLDRDERNRELEMDAALICKKKIKEHGLAMKLVAVEYTFDNAKLTFYFSCENRVDFRELVKDLAATFHTRIELHQIGIRDETKMMGGLGVCGRTYCCSGFLTDFVQVSIRMVKEQNFSLNSSKISGACGRLMCCLHFEHPVYEEALRVTPPVGSLVSSKDGNGTVIETRPLTAEVKVRFNEGNKEEIRLCKISELKVLKVPAGKKGAKADEDDEPAENLPNNA